jgi:methylase of polypeptide subunit release factors
MHSYKKRYYRLHIVVGKITLNSYPQFFSEEDKLALELKELFKEWERRTSLALIPFYMERLKFMEDERYKRARDGSLVPGEDTEFLLKNISETERKLQ